MNETLILAHWIESTGAKWYHNSGNTKSYIRGMTKIVLVKLKDGWFLQLTGDRNESHTANFEDMQTIARNLF